jgi:hypothetical protein
VERSWVHTGEGYEAQLVCIVHGEPAPEVSRLHICCSHKFSVALGFYSGSFERGNELSTSKNAGEFLE